MENISDNPGLLPYGSNVGAPAIKVEDVSTWKNRGVQKVNKQLNTKFNELKEEYNKIRDDIDKKESIIRKSNRDFTDVKDSLPEIQPKERLHVFEDYTVAFLSISYLFMCISFIYVYTYLSESKVNGFFRALLISFILTLFLFLFLYYLL